MLKNISLDKLKTIHSLYRTNSLSQTAKDHFVSASAISQSLSSLENQLDKQLFIKIGKKMTPTSYCAELIQIYEPFLQNMSLFLQNKKTESMDVTGELKIFVPGVAGSKILANPFSDFLKLHPKLNLALDSGSAARALKELHLNQFDFAVCGLKKIIGQHKWCMSHFLFNLNMNLYCSKDYFQKNKNLIQSKKFDQLEYISSYQDQYMLNWYFEEIHNLKFQFKSKLSVYDMNFMKKCVSNSLGIGLLAEELAQDEIKSGKIVKISQKSLTHPMFLIHQKQKDLSYTEARFREFLLDYFK